MFDFLGIEYSSVKSVKELLQSGSPLCVISGLADCTDEDAGAIRDFMTKGGKLLFLNSNESIRKIFHEYITGWIVPTEGDIVVMERPEAPVFNGIDPLELRYFNNNKREIPLACDAVMKAVRDENVTELASQMKIHAYIDDGKPEERIKRIESMRGLTLLSITDGPGKAIISTLCTEKALTDPVAGHLLMNMLVELSPR